MLTESELEEVAIGRERLATGHARIVRQGLHISQEEMRKRIGCNSRVRVSQWETGGVLLPETPAGLRAARFIASLDAAFRAGRQVL